MKATESDPELEIRGLVMARGGYTPSDLREFSPEELMFVYHYQNVNENRMFDRFSYLLGITWDVEDLKRMKTEDSRAAKSGKLFFPLASVIRPELVEHLRKTHSSNSGVVGQGEYKKQPGEVIVPMSTLSKEEFLRMIGKSKDLNAAGFRVKPQSDAKEEGQTRTAESSRAQSPLPNPHKPRPRPGAKS